MNIRLDLKQDKELRKEINEIIKGQVKAIAREDVKETVLGEIKSHVDNFLACNPHEIFERIIEKTIMNILAKDFGITQWGRKYIAPIVKERLDSVLTDGQVIKSVKEQVQVKINKMIKSLKDIGL